MKSPTITIVVATHKKYTMPKDPMYLPMLVGAADRDEDHGYAKDDFGFENISVKNPEYCELTGLFSAWKMLSSDFIGMVHYRRYFLSSKYEDPFRKVKLRTEKDKFRAIMGSGEMRRLARGYKVFVPKKRNYYIESLYSHYAHTHYAKHLDIARGVIREMRPDFLHSYDRVMASKSGYMFNMMIMRKDLVNDYCSFLFPVLFETERRIKADPDKQLTGFQARIYGRISELLFNVWIDKKLRSGMLRLKDIKELPYVYMGEVDYLRKAVSFMKAKLIHKKYESSF